MAKAKTSSKAPAAVKQAAKAAKMPAAKTTAKSAATVKPTAAKPETKTKPVAAAKSPTRKPAATPAKETTPAPKPVLVAAPPKAAVQPKRPLKAVPGISFQTGDFVVYPTHGVGRVTGIEIQEIAGHQLELIVISLEKDRMTLRVPMTKSKESGLRKLSSKDRMQSALTTLKGRARVKRTMWSRRAQEYEAKINSGDPVSIAEVVRDLFRKEDQPEQSYSERQIYQAALDRLARELAAIESIETDAASEKLENVLRKAA